MPQKVRRVVTGHDANGKAIVLFDGACPHVRVRGHGTASTLMWVTDKTPTTMTGAKDAADREIGVPPPAQGSIFRIVEFPPDTPESLGVRNEDVLRQMGVSPTAAGKPPRHPGMHRTASIDYAVVMSGEIDMLLDDSEVKVKAGDVVVQQGTIHAWANRSKAPCVIAFILIGATPPWAGQGGH
jgi:mannose-6-phosphate isomerase-like protein (cupin superfamily)